MEFNIPHNQERCEALYFSCLTRQTLRRPKAKAQSLHHPCIPFVRAARSFLVGRRRQIPQTYGKRKRLGHSGCGLDYPLERYILRLGRAMAPGSTPQQRESAREVEHKRVLCRKGAFQQLAEPFIASTLNKACQLGHSPPN